MPMVIKKLPSLKPNKHSLSLKKKIKNKPRTN
jgi:hypothetical protein